MKPNDILRTLGLLAGAGAALSACAKHGPPATEVPAASSPASKDACLHADGCCGGHTPGDATCGEDEAAETGGGDEPAAPAAAGPWTRTWTIAPGAMAEINLSLADGDTMAATFSTDGGPLAWNVHSHEGSEAIIHRRGEAASGELRHAVTKGGMYSFLWMNEGKVPVELTVELTSGAAKVHSTHPAE